MLTRRSPFVFAPMFHELDSLVRDLSQGNGVAAQNTVHTAVPPADVVETKEALEVKVDLPGHDPASIEVKLEEGVLTLSSERRLEKAAEGETVLRRERVTGRFSRTFTLPTTVDPARVEAKFEHGVLTVTLPRREEAKARVIEVKVQN